MPSASPSALVSALAAPLHEVQALVGPGWPVTGTPVTALAEAHTALAGIAAAARRSWNQACGDWSGAAAVAAEEFTAGAAARANALADRTGELRDGAAQAGTAVGSARSRLQAIIDRFEQRAAALEPNLEEPGVAGELLAEAQRSLREAIAVVDELRAELGRQAAAVTAGSAAPAATVPAAYPAGIPGGTPGGWNPSTGGLGGSGPAEAAAALRDPDMFGAGVAVRLPDGSSALAPNTVAAGAVRNALTQLGVPYRWGGTTPGVGLDCSGLTQWAYHEAGLNIPRLAQEQDVGAAVSADSLRPGDLAVWDGHVAMIVGGGTMVEAGDPVQLSPIRTTNAGQGFHGFFRPTA
ncbi:MAG TPA: C40 family peptidase [Mycobacterium sp.]|nr:C40 family peptidase [Mycobacterium sp.]